ncbi:MAG: hypothetical protein AAFY01_13600 [Pseudomonadota bacterium]
MTTRLPPGVLLPAEWVQTRAGLSRSVYLPTIFIAVLWGAVFIWATFIGLDLVALLAAAVAGIIAPMLGLWTFWRRRSTSLLLTDQRLVAVQGPYPRRVTALPLKSLDQMHVRAARGVVGFRFGSAKSVFATAFSDSGFAPVEMHDVVDADAFVRAVMSAASVHHRRS